MKFEIIDNEIPNQQIRYLWMSLLLQNTIFLVFSSFSTEKNEFNTSYLFIHEFLLGCLNVFSFVSVLYYKKGMIKTDFGIVDQLITNKPNKDESDVEKQEPNLLEKETSSFDIVNKFITFYEEEEKSKEIKRIRSCSFSSDEETNDSNSMIQRSQVFLNKVCYLNVHYFRVYFQIAILIKFIE